MEPDCQNIIVTGKSGAGKQPRIDVLTELFGLKQLSTGDIFRTYLGQFNKLAYEGPLDRFYDAASHAFIEDDLIKKTIGLRDDARAADIILGLKAGYYINQGLFVPDEITNALFKSAWRKMGYCGAVMDGYPRTPAQARFLYALAKQQGMRLDAILLVENDDQSIITRTVGRRICATCGEVFHLEHKPPPDAGHCGRSILECDIIQRSDDTIESLRARLNEFRSKTLPAIDYLTAQGIPLYRVPGNLPVFSPEAVKASVLDAMQIVAALNRRDE